MNLASYTTKLAIICCSTEVEKNQGNHQQHYKSKSFLPMLSSKQNRNGVKMGKLFFKLLILFNVSSSSFLNNPSCQLMPFLWGDCFTSRSFHCQEVFFGYLISVFLYLMKSFLQALLIWRKGTETSSLIPSFANWTNL